MSFLAPTIATPGFRWSFSNQAVPSATPGTSVVPGASDAEGAWTSIATGAQITEDVYGILFKINSGFTTTVSKMHLLDIGADPAAGTSYTALVENIQCGSTLTAANGTMIMFYVPIFIKAGSQVAVRIQGNAATAGTVRVWAILYGRPIRPEMAPICQAAETVGTITTSRGVVVTPGASAAAGAWTLIGTTTFPWRYLLPSLQIDDATVTAQFIWMDVGYGDATNPVVVVSNIDYATLSAETIGGGPLGYPDLWCDIPSGAEIYARLSTTIATPDSNYSVLVTGLG